MEKQKILIADDSEMNRALLAEILKEQYDVAEAENGAENVNDQTPDFGDTSVEEMMNQYGL